MKKVITEASFDAYKNTVEDMRNKGLSYREISERLDICQDYANQLTYSETYNDFRNHYRQYSKDRYAKRKMQEEENKLAREWSKDNTYAFGERVNITNPELAEITITYNGIEIQFKSCSAEFVSKFVKQLA